MPLFTDRVVETSTTLGTGAFTLAGAVSGYRAFSAGHIAGELVSYGIESVDANGNPNGDWEVGFGTLTTATTLTRHVAMESSNAGALVNFTAGTKRVWSNANAFLVANEYDVSQSARWNPPGSSLTTVPGIDGITTMTNLGTVTGRAMASTNPVTRARRLAYVSATTAAAISAHYTTAPLATIGTGVMGGFLFRGRFANTDAAAVSGARGFYGIRSSISSPTNVEPSTLTNQIGVAQLSTGTNLQLVTGGSAANAAIDLGAGFPATDTASLYELTIIAPRTRANVVLYNLERKQASGNTSVSNLIANATPGTTLPSNTTLLGYAAWRTNNATLLAVGMDFGTVIHYSDY